MEYVVNQCWRGENISKSNNKYLVYRKIAIEKSKIACKCFSNTFYTAKYPVTTSLLLPFAKRLRSESVNTCFAIEAKLGLIRPLHHSTLGPTITHKLYSPRA